MSGLKYVNPALAEAVVEGMKRLEFTAASPALDLAVDEALLDQAAQTQDARDLIRLWEPARTCVILGRASKVAVEVFEHQCADDDVPIVRRVSGGCAIVAGPGCCMFSLFLSLQTHRELRDVARAHAWILSRLGRAFSDAGVPVARAGTSDLVFSTDCGSRKFSGNSLRLKPDHLLYHGTLLFDFRLELIDRYLRHPPREPDYRRGSAHSNFVGNLPMTREGIRNCLIQAFGADEVAPEIPEATVARLFAERYSQTEWNLQV